VSVRGWITRLDGHRQRHEGGLGGIQRVGELLHARERRNARAKLVRMNRLREEVVSAGFDPLDPIREVR
jgi:hypothetical protein